MNGILGKKIGMTNIFDKDGRFIPVTLIEAGPCVVLGAKTKERDGYSSVLLGFGEKKAKKVKKPQEKLFKKLGVSPKKFIREIRTNGSTGLVAGDKVEVRIFKQGDFVDVAGVTIGKGFQGGVKRWHWAGGETSHGSMFHRAPGSIGASSFPSRVFKGQHLPGHMGAVRRTVQNLRVIVIDEEKNFLAVKGAVPGHRGNFLIVKHARKRPPKKEVKLDEGKKQ